MSKIFMAVPDEFGCGHYRARFPALHCFETLSKSGCYLEAAKDLTTEETSYDGYVFHRCPADTLTFHVNTLRKQGKKIAWQIDDDLWNIPDWMPSEEVNNQWSLNKAVELADQIWVSTEKLAQSIQTNKKIKILPNLIDINAFPKPGEAKNDPIRILWCGGRSHERDLDMIVEPIEQIALEYGNRVQFVFWGYAPTAMLEFSRINGSMEAMCRLKPDYGESICFLEGLPFRFFYDRLAKMRPYIALMPLVDCKFNECKSNLKYLEMSVVGAASIASKIAPYECIKNGHDGVLVDNSPNSWYKAIRDLIENPSLRDEMAKNAYQKVCQEYSWQSSARHIWLDAFRSLV